MIKHIANSFGKTANTTFQLSIPSNLSTNIETAIPLGLIITEMLTNSFKYAFTHHNAAQLTIQIRQLNGLFEAVYKDNGPGLSPNFDPLKSKSLGFRLIKNLVKQLKGKLVVETTMD